MVPRMRWHCLVSESWAGMRWLHACATALEACVSASFLPGHQSPLPMVNGPGSATLEAERKLDIWVTPGREKL